MRHVKIKQFVLLLALLLPAAWCGVFGTDLVEGSTHICIKERHVGGLPKGSSILATIDGHWLSVVFLEHLGQVVVEVSSTTIGEVETMATPTPNGVNIYITDAGSYIVTFTLPNGDEYYGEFEVTD